MWHNDTEQVVLERLFKATVGPSWTGSHVDASADLAVAPPRTRNWERQLGADAAERPQQSAPSGPRERCGLHAHAFLTLSASPRSKVF